VAVSESAPAATPEQRSDRWRENLARGNLAAAIMLLNLYVTLPTAGRGGRGIGDAFSSGPALAVHAVLGLLLILTALSMIIRSVIARHRASIVTSAVGLLAILAAAGYGASFTRDGSAAASLGMALATGVALLSYIIGLFVTGRAGPAGG
jgi:hypothetical protein